MEFAGPSQFGSSADAGRKRRSWRAASAGTLGGEDRARLRLGFNNKLTRELSTARMDSPEFKEAVEKEVEKRVRAYKADHHDSLVRLQDDKDALERNVGEQSVKLNHTVKELGNTKADLAVKSKEAGDLQNELLASRKSAANLEKDLEHEKAVAAESASILDGAYADLHRANDKFLAVSKARDAFELQQVDTQLQLEDLRAQWQEDQDKIAELEEHLGELHKLEETINGLQSDLDTLHETIADHERTLIVKDERIAHLEGQYQKERQRNLNVADAAAATATASSPIDEPPHIFPAIADSLEAELDAASDGLDSEYEHLEHIELSDVTAVADLTPIEPVSQAWTVNVTTAASVTPVEPTIPELSTHIYEAAHVSPIDSQVTTTSASAQTDTQNLTIELLDSVTLDIAPIAPLDTVTTATSTQTDTPRVDIPTLTTVLIDSARIQTSPIAPVDTATLTVSTQTDAPKLATSINDTADIAVSPVDALQKQTHTTPLNLSIEPVTVTLEMSPVEAFPPDETTEMATPSATPVDIATWSNEVSWLQWLLPVLALLATALAVYCISLYVELRVWRTANGVGFGNGMGGPHSRSGAYGNGRHLFGVIPVAMDVNSLWMPEVVSKFAAVAIERFEDWAGVSYAPHY